MPGLPISVCCLLASPHVDPLQWQTAFYQIEVVREDAAVAKEFIEYQVDQEGIEIGEVDTDVLVAAIHPGHVARCDGIDFAGVIRLNQDREMKRYALGKTFTICGMLLETGECYSGLWTAPGPLLAVSEAWSYFQEDEKTLLVSCAHEGTIPYAEWSPTYAEPTCTSDVTMMSRLVELMPSKEEPTAPGGMLSRIKRWAANRGGFR